MHRVSDTGPSPGHVALSQQRLSGRSLSLSPPASARPPHPRSHSLILAPRVPHAGVSPALRHPRLHRPGAPRPSFPVAAPRPQTGGLKQPASPLGGRGAGRAGLLGPEGDPVLARLARGPTLPGCGPSFPYKAHVPAGVSQMAPLPDPRPPPCPHLQALVAAHPGARKDRPTQRAATDSICDPDRLPCAGTGSGTSLGAPDPFCSTHHL